MGWYTYISLHKVTDKTETNCNSLGPQINQRHFGIIIFFFTKEKQREKGIATGPTRKLQ